MKFDEFLRNHAADDPALELVTLSGFLRFQFNPAVAVLAMAAGLPDITSFGLGGLADGFLVGNLGLAHGCLNFEFPKQAVHDDLQVKLAHAGDDRLAGFLVRVGLEGRIFFRKPLQGVGHFLLARFGLGLDRDFNHGIRENHAFQNDLVIFIAQGVARGGVLQAHRAGDLTGIDGFNLFPVVGVHQHNAADAMRSRFCLVEFIT